MTSYYKKGCVCTGDKQKAIANELEKAGMSAWRIGHIMTFIKYIDRMGEKPGEPFEKDAYKAADYVFCAMNGKWMKEQYGNETDC